MNTAHRIVAAAAATLLAVSVPAAASTHAPPAPDAPPAESPWPPAGTHGAFVPLPASFYEPATVPLCGSEVTITQEDVEPGEYRALVTEDGDTVVEYRGAITLDISRASDGAVLEDVLLDSSPIETYDADGVTATFDYPGPALVVATEEADVQALAEAGLPPAFLYLSGRLVSTTTLDSAPGTGHEPPAVLDVEIVENSTEYVFDVCHLLDQAAAEEAPAP